MRLKFPEPHFLPLKRETLHKAAVSNDILHARVCLDHPMEHGSVKAVSLRFWSPTVFPIPSAFSDPGLSDQLYQLHGWNSWEQALPTIPPLTGMETPFVATEQRAQCLLAAEPMSAGNGGVVRVGWASMG